MPPAPLPYDEPERLAALSSSGLLRKRVDPRMRSMTGLAASLLQRPGAALSLVTADMQVPRPSVGVRLRPVPREMSFCAHAILSPETLLVVEDARLDDRFADNPLVTGHAGLRFYAGMPVRAANGQPIGALCVLDGMPGSLSEAQRTTLRGLAREMEEIIGREPPAAQQRRALLHDLREAALAGSFDMHWQPIAAADTLRTNGYEALIRWDRGTGQPVAPDCFIPLAESSGLIGRIDRFVLEAACTEFAPKADGGSVSVNISAGWFRQVRPELARLVEKILSRTGLAAPRLVIEVTERMLIADPNRALAEMQDLKALGVRIALDDFGTGYSSLSYLEAFPFDTLKLDRAFVGGLGSNRRAEAVACAVIRLGHDLGMSVCAEGVETPRQLAFLRAEGCNMVQGYLIGRPGLAVH